MGWICSGERKKGHLKILERSVIQLIVSSSFTAVLSPAGWKDFNYFDLKSKKFAFFSEKLFQFVLPVPTVWNKSNVTFSQLLPLFFSPLPSLSSNQHGFEESKDLDLLIVHFLLEKCFGGFFLLLLSICNSKNKKSSFEAMFWSYNLSLPGNIDLCLNMEHNHRIIL